MKTAVVITAVALTGCASLGQPLAEKQESKRDEVNDGAVLIVDANGQMRMFNVYGAPLYMKDNVAMELKDGTIVTMKRMSSGSSSGLAARSARALDRLTSQRR